MYNLCTWYLLISVFVVANIRNEAAMSKIKIVYLRSIDHERLECRTTLL